MDDHASAFVHPLELLELIVELEERELVGVGEVVESDVEGMLLSSAAALLGGAATVMVHQQLVHGLAGSLQEERPIGSRCERAVGAKAHQRLVHQQSGLPGVVGPFPAHPARRDGPEVLVEDRHELLLGVGIPRLGPTE